MNKPDSVLNGNLSYALKLSSIGEGVPLESEIAAGRIASFHSYYALSSFAGFVTVALTGGCPLRLTPDTLPSAVWTFLTVPKDGTALPFSLPDTYIIPLST